MVKPPANTRPIRIIHQNPNTSPYSQRLSKEQWEDLKPTILDLLGRSTANILRELQSDNVHITRSQLDTQMKKWGFHKNKKEPFQQPMPPTQDDAMSEQSQEQHRYSNTTSLSSDGLSLIRTSDTELEVYISAELKMPEDGARADQPRDSIEPAEVARLASNDSSVFFDPETAMIEQRPSSEAATEPRRPESESSSDSRTADREHNREGQGLLDWERPEAASLAQANYPQLGLPEYEVSRTIQRLCRISVSKPGEIYEKLSRLSYTATLLFDMKCFSEAFEIFFLVVGALNDTIKAQKSWGYKLLFSAISCARSAFTFNQTEVGAVLLKQLRRWMEACYSEDHYHGEGIGVPPVVLHMRNLLTMAENLNHESRDETAYWIANATNLSLQNDITNVAGLLNLQSFQPLGAALFYESPDIQNTFVETLEVMILCLQHKNREIDQRIEKYWPPRDDRCVGRLLASLVLEYHISATPRGSLEFWRKSSLSSETRPFSQLKGQALVTLSFVVAESVRGSGKNKPTDAFLEAALWVGEVLSAGPGTEKYKTLIDLYLDQSRRQGLPWTTINIFTAEYLVNLAATVANRMDLSAIEGLRPRQASLKTNKAGNFSYAQDHEAERSPTRESFMDPPVSRSYRSSMSSAYRSFKALSTLLRSNVSVSNLSLLTFSTGRRSDRMSWLSTMTGLPSNSSVRDSTASDVVMDGIDEDADEIGVAR